MTPQKTKMRLSYIFRILKPSFLSLDGRDDIHISYRRGSFLIQIVGERMKQRTASNSRGKILAESLKIFVGRDWVSEIGRRGLKGGYTSFASLAMVLRFEVLGMGAKGSGRQSGRLIQNRSACWSPSRSGGAQPCRSSSSDSLTDEGVRLVAC